MGAILTSGHFTVVGRNGVVRESASMAHAMTWFRDRLYVGTSNWSARDPEDGPLVLRLDPRTGAWETVFEPGLTKADARSEVVDVQIGKLGQVAQRRGTGRSKRGVVPREFGYRSMAVFQGSSDPEPALYMSTMSYFGGMILRSLDGETFETVSEPGMGNPAIMSFRGLVGFGGRLFAAPAGTVTAESIDRNMAPETIIFASEDPAGGKWTRACEPGFGDPGNTAIYALGVGNGQLYASTANPERGMQVWRTSADGEPPFAWERVVTDGAGAFNHNLAACAIAEFGGALYVGSGITGFGYDKVHDIGPAAGELIRIWPDGSWDLIVGRPRFTPSGLKVPLSTLGPGLDDPYNSVVWSLREHEGVLYLGTHQWEAIGALEHGTQIAGGFQLWGSTDGEEWRLVLEDGLGNPGEVGIRTIVSSPHGLFLGTCNHGPLLKFMARMRGRDAEVRGESGFRVLQGC